MPIKLNAEDKLIGGWALCDKYCIKCYRKLLDVNITGLDGIKKGKKCNQCSLIFIYAFIKPVGLFFIIYFKNPDTQIKINF
jgi:hypothetical protein